MKRRRQTYTNPYVDFKNIQSFRKDFSINYDYYDWETKNPYIYNNLITKSKIYFTPSTSSSISTSSKTTITMDIPPTPPTEITRKYFNDTTSTIEATTKIQNATGTISTIEDTAIKPTKQKITTNESYITLSTTEDFQPSLTTKTETATTEYEKSSVTTKTNLDTKMNSTDITKSTIEIEPLNTSPNNLTETTPMTTQVKLNSTDSTSNQVTPTNASSPTATTSFQEITSSHQITTPESIINSSTITSEVTTNLETISK